MLPVLEPLLLYALPELPLLPEDIELPLLPVVCDEVVESCLSFFFMSPSARALLLARATMDVKMNAGASLRIWASFCGFE